VQPPSLCCRVALQLSNKQIFLNTNAAPPSFKVVVTGIRTEEICLVSCSLQTILVLTNDARKNIRVGASTMEYHLLEEQLLSIAAFGAFNVGVPSQCLSILHIDWLRLLGIPVPRPRERCLQQADTCAMSIAKEPHVSLDQSSVFCKATHATATSFFSLATVCQHQPQPFPRFMTMWSASLSRRSGKAVIFLDDSSFVRSPCPRWRRC
jgi:hypothetical protein